MKIMIVDPGSDTTHVIRLALREILGRKGIDAEFSYSPDPGNALSRIARKKFDMIVIACPPPRGFIEALPAGIFIIRFCTEFYGGGLPPEWDIVSVLTEFFDSLEKESGIVGGSVVMAA